MSGENHASCFNNNPYFELDRGGRMKFFKHFVDAHEGKSIMALMDQFGHKGYSTYFILMEICSRKMEKSRDEEYTETHCKFIIHERLIRDKCRLNSTLVSHILHQCETLGLLECDKIENEYHLYIPKLLECIDRDAKRARPVRDIRATRPSQDKELDKDKEQELELELPKQKKARSKSLTAESANADIGKQASLLIARYCELWKAKYKTTISFSNKWAGNAKTLVKDHGLKRSIELVEAFMEMNDTWFIQNRHSFELILVKLAQITHYAGTGVQITKTQLNQLDKTQANKSAGDEAAEYFRKQKDQG